MYNEKDIYNKNRITKINNNFDNEDIRYERSSSRPTPIERRHRPTYNRQSIPETAKPSTLRQARPIDEKTVSRQIRPTQARVADPRQVRPTNVRVANPNQSRPTEPRQARPTSARPGHGNLDVNRAYSNRKRQNPYNDRNSYYDENRRPSNQNRNRRKSSNKLSWFTGFKKFIIIYSAILLLIVVITSIILSSFLKNYEINQPTVLAANIAENLTKNPSSYLSKNKDKINCLENVDNIIEKSAQLINGEKVSFIENSDYRADAPSYDFIAGNNTVAKVTFETSNKGAFGLNSWKIKKLEVAEFIPDTINYTLYAPEGASISINDHVIDDTYKTADVAVPEHLLVATQFVTINPYITYKVSGFTNTPSVKASDANGTELGTTITSNTIVVGASTPQEFIDEVKPMVDDCIEQWAKHFINYGDNLRKHIYMDTDLYAYIFGSATVDPIPTQFYEYESITNIDFAKKESNNYIRYTDHCFTTDISYDLKVSFSDPGMSDDNQNLDATWVWVYIDSISEWQLVDCIYK